MKWLLPLSSEIDLQSRHGENFEFFVSSKELSRFGKLELNEAIRLAEKAREQGFKVALQCDLLLTQTSFDQVVSILNRELLGHFDSARIQEAGLVHYFKQQFPDTPIQLILETGNHNLVGVQTWQDYLGGQLERIVLSHELPKEKLKIYAQSLKVPLEILGAGRLLLFYTPRSLVSAQYVDHDDSLVKRQLDGDMIEISASSEESPHTGFPVVENKHGTFMFLPKDFFLLDQFSDLQELGLSYLRVDFTHLSDKINLENYLINADEQKLKELKQLYPLKSIKGFFNTNKSDVLFPKLKNSKTQRRDENFCGEVLEVAKKKYIAVLIESSKGLRLGDQITYYSPDSKVKMTTISSLKNSQNQEVENLAKGDVAIVPHVGGISIKSMVYFGDHPLV